MKEATMRIGIDLGGTKIEALAIDKSGKERWSKAVAYNRSFCSRSKLTSALKETSRPLQRRLSEADSTVLLVLLGKMARRYPSQDMQDAMTEYLADYEALAVKYSLRSVEEALGNLRIDPEQSFFPRPDEVAEEIELMAEVKTREAEERRHAAERVEREADFWRHVEFRMEAEGLSEQQVLDTIRTPGYVGRKAREK